MTSQQLQYMSNTIDRDRLKEQIRHNKKDENFQSQAAKGKFITDLLGVGADVFKTWRS